MNSVKDKIDQDVWADVYTKVDSTVTTKCYMLVARQFNFKVAAELTSLHDHTFFHIQEQLDDISLLTSL